MQRCGPASSHLSHVWPTHTAALGLTIRLVLHGATLTLSQVLFLTSEVGCLSL